jgi:hypothetical protein
MLVRLGSQGNFINSLPQIRAFEMDRNHPRVFAYLFYNRFLRISTTENLFEKVEV